MEDPEFRRRSARAEIFIGESVAGYMADLADEAYSDETDTEGFLLGRMYVDAEGIYAVAGGVSREQKDISGAVGWFRSSRDGCSMTQADISRHVSFFGNRRSYAVMIDPFMSSMAVYVVENGTARKAASLMVENL